jgi:hypothetical protein
MRLKLGLAVTVLALGAAAFAAVATPSRAATTGIPIQGVTCTGTTGTVPCSLTLTGFKVIGNALNAVFSFTANGQTTTTAVPLNLAGTNGSCTILDLTIGPINLDLLGLVVQTNQIHLQITAQQGPGNLLGNLLCGLANALNGGGSLTQISNILNRLLSGGLLTAV